MKKETLKSIFNFIEEKEARKTPFLWKLLNDEPLTEDDLYVKGDLNLRGSKIKSLPKGLKVGGFLSLIDCSNLETLPEGLEVEGWLDLENTSITSLPKGLKVYGDVYRRKTELEAYTDKQLREMIKPGFVKGLILK